MQTPSSVAFQPIATSPIGVFYAGYWFESPLEARWAMFFDMLGVQWEHPRARFGLPPTHHYLPDFWLPLQQCWIQVVEHQPDEEQQIKAADLAFSIHKWVVIVWGAIGTHHMYAYYPPFYEQGYYRRYTFALCDQCGHLIVASPMRGSPDELLSYCHVCAEMVIQPFTGNAHPRLLVSYSAARRAHLEHAHLGQEKIIGG